MLSFATPVQCDICMEVGKLSADWVTLRDFAYVKHACPKCVGATDSYGGSHLRDARLSGKVREATDGK